MRKVFVFLTLLIYFFSACETSPPIKIKSLNGNCLSFDFQKLGEYSTMIDSIEIIDVESNTILWTAKPLQESVVRISGLELCKGTNLKKIKIFGDSDQLAFSVMGNKDSFTLIEGKIYSIKVVSPEHKRIATVTFNFPRGMVN